ncbi:unnamed protein product [Caenorhabditis bovis]|uniref:Unspecific monooxygenase n=1 Tax=Caenorhabditis bovis TaxID=2654633 RepID=A0A8S1EYK2_9PELO|nr:unnamed protein product [Caenorhabditis bovis]
METTSNTLYWSVLYCLTTPRVVENINKELKEKVNGDRIITMADKNDLVYINATINEVQRLANLLPLNVSHATTEDVEINGLRIPKDTIIVPQISCVLYDEKIFPDPHSFNPSRFIGDDGKLLKVEELVPFSIGKRQCLGEGLARMELFLFFANLFNQFEVYMHL